MRKYNEEIDIMKRFGNQNHFSVPEGYFDRLTEQVMERLPERELHLVKKAPLWRRYRVAFVAAACTLFAFFGVGIYRQLSFADKPASTRLSADNSYVSSESYTFDEMADYAMIDSDVIYASLSDYEY